jgi:hypothetical protein
MENAVSLSVSPFQVLLAVGFQVWLLVFPILILRKIDRLTALIEEKFAGPEEVEQPGEEEEGNGGS